MKIEGNVNVDYELRGKLSGVFSNVIDNTLSMEGAAADAKATGDAIAKATADANVAVEKATADANEAIAKANDAIRGLTPASIGAAPAQHRHSTDDLSGGVLPIGRGGTGGATPADARLRLGITPANIGAAPAEHSHDYAAPTHKHSASDINSGTLPVERGGTGAANAETARAMLGLSDAIKVDKIWTNSSPTSSFPSKTIVLNVAGEILFWIIEFTYSPSMPTYRWTEVLPSETLTGENGNVIRAVHVNANDSKDVVSREIIAYSDTIYAGVGKKNGSEDNTVAIPYRVSVVRKV